MSVFKVSCLALEKRGQRGTNYFVSLPPFHREAAASERHREATCTMRHQDVMLKDVSHRKQNTECPTTMDGGSDSVAEASLGIKDIRNEEGAPKLVWCLTISRK